MNEQNLSDWWFADEIYTSLVPFSCRKRDPVAMMQTLKTGLDELPKHKTTFISKEIGLKQFYSSYRRAVERVYLLEAAPTQRKKRYYNPQYGQLTAYLNDIEGDTERMQHYERFRESPTLTVEWLAERWGTTPEDVRWFLHGNGINIEDKIAHNQRRMGLTIRATAEWGHYSAAEYADALPVDNRTIHEWVTDVSHVTIPDRPTDKDWWRKNNRRTNRESA